MARAPFETLPGQTDLMVWLSENPDMRQAPIPPVPPEELSAYDVLEAVGQIRHGARWHGKIAPILGVAPRQVVRWSKRRGGLPPWGLDVVRYHALKTAAALLDAAGYPDLAAPVRARMDVHVQAALDAWRAVQAERASRPTRAPRRPTGSARP